MDKNFSQSGVYPPYNGQNNPGQVSPQSEFATDSAQHNSVPVQPYYMRYAVNTQPKKKKNTGLIVFLCIVIAVLAIGMISLGVLYLNNVVFESSDDEETMQSSYVYGAEDQIITPEKDDGNNDLSIRSVEPGSKKLTASQIVKQSKDSVLGINAYETNGVLEGQASCVVLGKNKSGTKTYVLTCAHVINNEECVYFVEDSNGKEFKAAVVGCDEKTDLGVLSVKGVDFKAAEIGDSSVLQAGETVVAMGNPGGSEFYGSVTQGIISAVNRPLSFTGGYTSKCIQHDAAINPGNSGGALFNMYGQVIGINSSKISATTYEGMAFAIPSESFIQIVDELIQNGRAEHARLGVNYVVSTSYVYDGYKQLIINDIDEKSDLNGKAEVGDYIIGINGQRLTSQYELTDLIDSLQPGDEITLNMARLPDGKDGEPEKFDVTVKLIAIE